MEAIIERRRYGRAWGTASVRECKLIVRPSNDAPLTTAAMNHKASSSGVVGEKKEG